MIDWLNSTLYIRLCHHSASDFCFENAPAKGQWFYKVCLNLVFPTPQLQTNYDGKIFISLSQNTYKYSTKQTRNLSVMTTALLCNIHPTVLLHTNTVLPDSVRMPQQRVGKETPRGIRIQPDPPAQRGKPHYNSKDTAGTPSVSRFSMPIPGTLEILTVDQPILFYSQFFS